MASGLFSGGSAERPAEPSAVGQDWVVADSVAGGADGKARLAQAGAAAEVLDLRLETRLVHGVGDGAEERVRAAQLRRPIGGLGGDGRAGDEGRASDHGEHGESLHAVLLRTRYVM